MPAHHRLAQTSTEVKRLHKQKANTLSTQTRRQLERGLELDRRAHRMRQQDLRRREARRKREVKERREREARSKAGISVATQCVGFSLTQRELRRGMEAFLGVGKDGRRGGEKEEEEIDLGESAGNDDDNYDDLVEKGVRLDEFRGAGEDLQDVLASFLDSECDGEWLKEGPDDISEGKLDNEIYVKQLTPCSKKSVEEEMDKRKGATDKLEPVLANLLESHCNEWSDDQLDGRQAKNLSEESKTTSQEGSTVASAPQPIEELLEEMDQDLDTIFDEELDDELNDGLDDATLIELGDFLEEDKTIIEAGGHIPQLSIISTNIKSSPPPVAATEAIDQPNLLLSRKLNKGRPMAAKTTVVTGQPLQSTPEPLRAHQHTIRTQSSLTAECKIPTKPIAKHLSPPLPKAKAPQPSMYDEWDDFLDSGTQIARDLAAPSCPPACSPLKQTPEASICTGRNSKPRSEARPVIQPSKSMFSEADITAPQSISAVVEDRSSLQSRSEAFQQIATSHLRQTLPQDRIGPPPLPPPRPPAKRKRADPTFSGRPATCPKLDVVRLCAPRAIPQGLANPLMSFDDFGMSTQEVISFFDDDEDVVFGSPPVAV